MIEKLETIRETEEKAKEIVETARAQAADVINEAEKERSEVIKKAKAAAQKKGADIFKEKQEAAEKEAQGISEAAAVERGHLAKAAESGMENAIKLVMERLIS
jgi:ATP synthase H subunit